MTARTPEEFGQRNARLYVAYSALFNAFFWLPIFFLYFSAHVTLEQVLLLEAIYYATVFLLEVPSGYLSDRVGRKPTLLLSASSFVLAYILFATGDGFPIFAVAQCLLAAGMACNSGTDTSFHYDSLSDAGALDEYDSREATIARNAFLAMAITAVAGGAIGSWNLSAPYWGSFIAASLSLIIVLRMREPSRVGPEDPTHSLPKQARDLLGYLRQPMLRWLFVFAVLMTILKHIPYEFYQPYLRLLFQEDNGAQTTPIIAGVHAGVAMLIGAWCAHISIRLRDRLGVRTTMLISMTIQVVQIAIMGMVLHPIVAVLLLTRSAPSALYTAPMNAAIAPKLKQHHRATWFSLQSLAGRIGFALTLVGLSTLARDETVPDAEWVGISDMLLASALLGVVGGLVLVVLKTGTQERGEA